MIVTSGIRPLEDDNYLQDDDNYMYVRSVDVTMMIHCSAVGGIIN